MPAPKQQYLDAYEREHTITMRLLRAYPPDKLDLKPHPKCKSARELAWMFVGERGLGTVVLKDQLNPAAMSGMPQAPADWNTLLGGIEQAHKDFGELVGSYSDAQLAREREVLHRAEDDGRSVADQLPVVPALGPDSPSRAVLDLLAHGRWQGAVDLRAERG